MTVLAQPIAAACVVASLLQPAGRSAGLLSVPWMSFALLVAAMGLGRATGWRRPAELCAAGALIYLPVGAGWLVASRMGLQPLGFDPIIVSLTAVHFHYAAFAAPIVASRTIATLEGRPERVASIAGIAILVAQPIVAAGITGVPPLALFGAVLLGGWLIALAVVTLGWARKRVEAPTERALVTLSALPPLFSMPLAVAWSWGQVSGRPPLALATMIDVHGTANAYGFALLGLIAWYRQRNGVRT